jgi:hypothetical protein
VFSAVSASRLAGERPPIPPLLKITHQHQQQWRSRNDPRSRCSFFIVSSDDSRRASRSLTRQGRVLSDDTTSNDGHNGFGYAVEVEFLHEVSDVRG